MEKLFVVMNAFGIANAYRDEKDAVEDFNSHVVEENRVDSIEGGVAGDGDYDEQCVVLASDVKVPEVKDSNGFDWEDLAQWLITDMSELDGPFECCKKLLYYGLTNKQLLYLGFEQETIVRAIKEFKEENPQ